MTINPETLPPLEVSVTGIEREEASTSNLTQDPSASQNSGSHSQGLHLSQRESKSFPLQAADGSQDSPSSSSRHNNNNNGSSHSRNRGRTTSVLHKYWDAFQQTVSPTIGFEAPAITSTDEAQRAAAQAAPLQKTQEEEEEEDQPRVHHHHGRHRGEALAQRVSRSRHQHKQSLTKAALAQLTQSTSLSDDAPRSPTKRNSTTHGQDPAKPPFQRNNSAASTASKLSILAVDRDFDQLLTSTLQAVPSDGLSGGAGSGSHSGANSGAGSGPAGAGSASREGTPRNSWSARPAMKQAGSSHSLDSSGPKSRQLASHPPTPAVHSSGGPAAALQHSQSAMSYPPAPQAQDQSPGLEKSNTPSSRAVLDELWNNQSPSTDTSSTGGSRLINWFTRVGSFLHPEFEPCLEKAFRKESWMMRKAAAVASSVLLVCLWITYAASSDFTHTVERVLFYGIDLPFSLLMIIAILFDVALRLPWLYQGIGFVNCWAMPVSVLISGWQCHFFFSTDHSTSTCPPSRDFLSVLLWPLAFPVVHLFLLSSWRCLTLSGFIAWLGIAIWTIAKPHNKAFGVNLVNVVLFQCAILWTSLLRERSERHLFLLNQRVRKQIEQTRQAQVLERKAEDSKQAFVSYIFHEVRIPLNAALLASQNLEAESLLGSPSSDHKDMGRALNSSLLTMQRVLNDVLDYQRMESGRLKWMSAPFNLHEAVHTVVDSYQPFAESRKVEMQVNLDGRIDRLSRVLIGDPMRVSQILSNLLSNACKAARQRIQCRTQLLFPMATASLDIPVRAALVRIEVEDDGDGVLAQDLQDQKLFSPYVQTETQLQDGGKGVGLGLALTKENVKLAGGRLGVNSKKGSGATFWIELVFALPVDQLEPTRLNVTPIVPPVYIRSPSSERTARGDKVKPPATDRPLHILLVEDDPITCKMMQRMLSRQGHTSEVAASGEEALVKIRAGSRYDLAFLDGNLGDMQGWDCLKEMTAAGFSGYACGLSGNGDAKDYFDAAGAHNTLLKPLSGDALHKLLAKVMEWQSQPGSPPTSTT